jgi:hypothetical protein
MSTTSAAFTDAAAGSIPWTRFRKLGSHAQTDDRTMSWAGASDEDPGERPRTGQDLHDAARNTARRMRGMFQRRRELDRSIVAHEEIKNSEDQAGHTDHAEGCLPAPFRGDDATEHHAQNRADEAEAKKAAIRAPRMRSGK